MAQMAAAPPSAASATTNGGCAFEQLCRRTTCCKPNYACDNTVDIRGINFEDAKKRVLFHIGNCIHCIQTESDQVVTKFYIGKTFAHQKKKRVGSGYVPIDPQKRSTYRKGGIGSRWREHSKNDYGRDGMVVLTVVTRHAVPKAARSTCKLHQEDYAFALEQTLLHHFMITFPDSRIANNGFATGGTDNRGSAAYAIYMAFRMEESESDIPNSPTTISSHSLHASQPAGIARVSAANRDSAAQSSTSTSLDQASHSIGATTRAFSFKQLITGSTSSLEPRKNAAGLHQLRKLFFRTVAAEDLSLSKGHESNDREMHRGRKRSRQIRQEKEKLQEAKRPSLEDVRTHAHT